MATIQWVGIGLLAVAVLAWFAIELIWRRYLRTARLYAGPASGVELGRSLRFLRAEWYDSSAAGWVHRAQYLWLVAYASFALGGLLLLFGTA
jgi:hypothetical protein